MNILVTGGAGFIGSNLVDALLDMPQVSKVVVLDNLATGSKDNLIHAAKSDKFSFIEGDIRDKGMLNDVCKDIDLIAHQAALGSVPRSIEDPSTSNDVNVTGTLNVFNAARTNNIKRVIYAASSSTYGDHQGTPKKEDKIGNPLSPYAVTKLVNELYARVYNSVYGLETIGLRYFNVYGPRQNPRGPYAAVIPLFVQSILRNEQPTINGDGTTSRDFTYVSNVVQANIKALFTKNPEAVNQVYNVACGQSTTINELFQLLAQAASSDLKPLYGEERLGDIKYSLADITKAKNLLEYQPDVLVDEGMIRTFDWYKANKQLLDI